MNQRREGYPIGTPAFDLGAAIVLAIFVLGGYVDGWAHNHFGSILETFFTPWHAVLYGGFFVSALYLVIPALRNRRAGYDWRHSLPYGYATSLVGIALFIVAGFCDLVWHTLYGVEASVDAFLSPPHLALFCGALLMTGGTLRAIVHRNGAAPQAWAGNVPFVLVLALFFMQLTFMTQVWMLPGNGDATPAFAPNGSYWSTSVRDLDVRGNLGVSDVGGLHGEIAVAQRKNEIEQPTRFETALHRLGTYDVILYAVLISALLLFTLKVGRIPPGTFTILFFFDTLVMALMRELWLPASFMVAQIVLGLAWGIVADILYGWCRPSIAASSRLYTFMFFTPACIVGLYFAALAISGVGTWWLSALWSGSIIYAGAIGVGLALVASQWDGAAASKNSAIAGTSLSASGSEGSL